MKTSIISVWATAAVASTLGSSAPAQSFGECTEQVLGAPTESSVRVRLKGVTQWPVNPICFWNASGVGPTGQTYTWQAVLIGDGLLDPPDSVNVSVQFRYTGPLGCSSALVNFFPPYPSGPFTSVVTSDGGFAACSEDSLPMSFCGTLSLDASDNFTVDITFTGGTPPLPDVSDLIAMVSGSSLPQRQKRPLLATLEAANVSLVGGDCKTGATQLYAFQNKVRAQVARSDATGAEALIAGAQAIIEFACGACQ
jgi:hypothetical protein